MKIHLKNNSEINIDKKYILIGTIFLIIILIVILSKSLSNELVCTKEQSNSTITATEIYRAKFKNGKLNQLIVEYTNTPTEEYIDMIDEIYNNYESQLKELKNNGGYDYSLEKTSKYVKFKSTIDLDKIPDSTKTAIGFNNEWNREDFKKDLEDSGFTCK